MMFHLLAITCFWFPFGENDQLSAHPDAPPETSQYAFLVGVWECETKSMTPNGDWVAGRARWEGYFILHGWAIQDDWTSFNAEGQPVFFGTNIRSFNPELKKWECRWLPSGSLTWKHFLSWQDKETMVMEGKGKDARGEFLDRNTFHDIGANTWSWRKDRSYDGGKTWIEGIAHIHAKRKRT